MTIWDDLAAEFPREVISWRAQSITKNGDKAMALAYLDARDIRRRLNQVVGAQNWMNEFRDCGNGRLACRLSIRVDGEWIYKEDGAGETQVEAEKGAFSGALKRAAVAFGIGEYLYDMPTVWAPCETTDFNGKKQWKAWIGDPWNHVRGTKPSAQPAPQKPAPAPSQAPKTYSHYLSAITNAETEPVLKAVFAELWRDASLSEQDKTSLKTGYEAKKIKLTEGVNA